MTNFSIGIDIGGTFTDLVLQDRTGEHQTVHKILTTRDDPGRAVLEGVGILLERAGVAPERIERVVHATTLFTNSLIEREGASTGLITTAGFGDVLEIGRERKYDLYDLFQKKPLPLVPRELRREIDERLGPDGTVELPLDMAEVERAVGELVNQGVAAIAVVFLHAYANSDHETKVADLIRAKHPDIFVCTSSEVSPVIREYERLSTTVANAYIGPLAEQYLDDLVTRMAGLGIKAPFFIMSSNGGVNDVTEAKRVPVQLLESGPAAGALAGAYFGGREGHDRLLAFDMGGTTAKMCIVDDGEPIITHTFEAARERRFRDGSGLPVSISTVELIEIGAGGGSIASVDAMGLLKVGPRSAGASPGPACYNRGGTEPTVTDADLTMGLLNPDYFLGGTMTIDPDASVKALGGVAEQASLDAMAVATGINEIVNESMASAARVHTAERAYEARRFAMLATGGAGPVHAYMIARKLGISTMICPPSAGVGSAVGLLIAPARIDRSATYAGRLDALDTQGVEAAYRTLEEDARRVVANTGGDLARAKWRRQADMRYVGQGSELTVTLDEGATPDGPTLRKAFETAYEISFARILPDAAVELVTLRVTLLAPTTEAEADGARVAGAGVDAESARKGTRKLRLGPNEPAEEAGVYDRYKLPIDVPIQGPAVIEESETTILIGREGTFVRRPNGNIVVTLDHSGSANGAANG